MVERKFVIFVGKKTVNGICFKKNFRPVSFPQRTLEEKDTEEFFKTNQLNEKYLRTIIYTKYCSNVF